MIRRPLWLGAGVALGVGGTLWAEQRVRRGARRLSAALTPAGAAGELRRSAQAAGGRLRAAVDEGRLERRRREAELWARLDRPAPVPALPVVGLRAGQHAGRGARASRGAAGQHR